MKEQPSAWLDTEALKPTAGSVLLDYPLQQCPNVGPEDDLREALVAMPSFQDVRKVAPGLSDIDNRSATARTRCGKLRDD